MHTFPFFTSDPVTLTVRHRMASSDWERVASGTKAEVPLCDTDAGAGAFTGAEVGAWAKADVMIPMVKVINRIDRMTI